MIDKAWVMLVTPDFRKVYSIDASNLRQTITALREKLILPIGDPKPSAYELYRKIFLNPQLKGPTLDQDLKTYLHDQPNKTLMWSLDGELRRIPMAALYDGEKYLVERYRNVVFTSVSPALTASVSRQWTALGLAVSKPYPPLPELKATPREMLSVVREKSNTSGVLPGVIRLDDQFTEQAMLDGLREGYPVVHIASHYVFDDKNLAGSFLLLGDGTHLETSRIEEGTNIFEKQDLVTLSACETARTSANGKEVEAFSDVVQKLGAKAVIASVWEVDDAGTQILMPEFYHLRETGLTKAEALQRAQMAMLSGDLRDAKGSQLRHPYYWAPFILIGNFK